MVCPVKNQPSRQVEVATEYPFESLYRPWSWIWSSLFNVFLFAVLLGIFYFYYRTRKNLRNKRIVTYRTVQVSQEESEEMKRKTALVTGGNGALGTEIVQSLIRDGGYKVLSLDILFPEDDKRNEGVNTYIQADITNLDDLFVAFKNVDVVFHCGSLAPISVRHSKDDYYQVNIVGTENIIKACAECGVKCLLYTSTAAVTWSNNPKEASFDCDESTPLPNDPLNVYVATMGKADQLVREANGKDGVATCVLRPHVTVQKLFGSIEENLYFPAGFDFETSLVSLESAAQAHLLAEKKLSGDADSSNVVAGKAYNICDQKVSILKFAKFIATEKKSSLTYLPLSLVKFLTWINDTVYRLMGIVAISESLTSMSMQHGSHTYTSSLAKCDLGWVPGIPWEDVVKSMLKKKAEEGNKKDN